MKFAANISTLCQDIPKLTDRLIRIMERKDFKFDAIECQNPFSVPISEWKELASKYQFKWILINTPPLFEAIPDPVNGRTPSKEEYHELVLTPAIEYAKQLSIPKVHLVMTDTFNDLQKQEVVDLLQYAAKAMAPDNITCVLEPLSIRPNYYLRSYEEAVKIVSKCGQANLKVMLDTFHMQRLGGNLTETIKAVSGVTGHVQVSQVPLRNCPMVSGELNYGYVLKQLANCYTDYVGLEYFNESTESFSWLNDYLDI